LENEIAEPRLLARGQLLRHPFSARSLLMPVSAVSGTQSTQSTSKSTPVEVKSGTYRALHGKVINQTLYGPGGEAPPSGEYLKLSTPISVDGKATDQIYLGHKKELVGKTVTLNGRLDIGTYGGVETRPGTYVQLSGVSNLTAGEPRFDGVNFTGAGKKKLPVVSLPYPAMLADAPGGIMVIDQGKDHAYIGTMGGFIPPQANPFHGFRARRLIKPATAKHQAEAVMDSNGRVRTAAGKEIPMVGKENGKLWFVDVPARTAYRFNGPNMDQVVRMKKGDIPFAH
jgi:hypothetical protein